MTEMEPPQFSEQHELDVVVRSPVNETEAEEQAAEPTNGQILLPHDRGRAAWQLLGAVFVFEALLWGGRSYILVRTAVLTGAKAFRYPSAYSRTITLSNRNSKTRPISVSLEQLQVGCPTWPPRS